MGEYPKEPFKERPVYDMPLSDAILVENGAVTRVNRIVRAIERTEGLAKNYIENGLTAALIAAAEKQAEAHRVSLFGERAPDQDGKMAGFTGRYSDKFGRTDKTRSPFKRTADESISSRIDSMGPNKGRRRGADREAKKGQRKGQMVFGPYVKLSPGVKLRIAKYLRIGDAYERGIARKRGYLFGKDAKGLKFGTKQTRHRDAAGELLPQYKMGGYATRGAVGSTQAHRAELKRLRDEEFRGPNKPPEYYEKRRAARSMVAAVPKYNEAALTEREVSRRRATKQQRQARTLGVQQFASYREALAAWKTAGNTKGSFEDIHKAFAAAGKPGFTSKAKAKNNPYFENPFGYDDLAIVTNPSGIGVLDSAESMIAGVPVVGEYIAPIVTPAVLGAAAFGVHYFAVPYVEKYLPAVAKPFAYTIGGSAVGIVSGVVAAKAQDSSIRNAAALIGGAAVAIGVGLDLFRKYGGGKAGDADFGDDMGADEFGDDMGALALDNPGVFGSDEFGALALDNPGVFGALALDNPGVFGDGMAYQLGPVGGFNGFGALGYANASLADAYYSGADFDGVEGEAILAGPHAFAGAAGPAPRMAAGARTHASNLAGRRYHRWAWLINEIGFDSLQKLAALSPSDRLAAIQALRARALQAYQAKLATQGGEFHRLPAGLSVGGPMAPGAAPGVGDALGYGALAVADY
jgi:hypothetical protein